MNRSVETMLLAAAVGAVLVTGGISVQAQENDPKPFDFSLDVRGEYTDNRDSSETDEESNFDTYVAPRVDANLVFEPDRTDLIFHYQPSFRFRSDPGETQNDNELQHDAGLNFRHKFTDRTALRLHEVFILTDDPSIEEAGSTVRRDETYFRNRFGGAVKHDWSKVTWTQLDGEYDIKRYDEESVAEESDEDRLSLSASQWRRVAKTLAVRGLLGYSGYQYDSALNIDRDFDVLALIAGLEKWFARDIMGELSAGLQAVEYSDSSIDGDTLPFGRAALSYFGAKAIKYYANVEHGVRDSDVYPFASQEYTELHGRIEGVTGKLTLVGGATYRMSTYDENVLPQGAAGTKASEGDEDTIVLGADAIWALTEAAHVRVGQRFEDIDSDVETSFTKNTSTVELLLNF